MSSKRCNSLLSLGQGGQQVVTQIIRGQAVSTAIPGAGPVATVSGQAAASPTAVGHTQPGTTRTQGQGQVKLTLAQLGQLIQVSEESVARITIARGCQCALQFYTTHLTNLVLGQEKVHGFVEIRREMFVFVVYFLGFNKVLSNKK